MGRDKQSPNEIAHFVGLLREGMPTLIEQGTSGEVLQTAYRDLLPPTKNGEAAFAVFLNSGVSYRIRVQQIGEAEVEETGCRRCGELFPAHELNEHGSCPGCAQEWWDRLTAQEQAEYCKQYKVHQPYEDKGPMSAEQLLWIAELLESHPWRFAKTMPRNPHWYTLRHGWQDVGDEVYNQVNRMIREHGRTEWFGTYPWRMLDVNGFKYWNYYSSRIEDVNVLNRKPL